MSIRKSFDRKTILIAISVVVLLLVILPVPIPYHLVVQGKIVPGRIWLLQRQNDGSLLVTLRDHLNNLVTSYAAYQVERGDVLSFELSPRLGNGGWIAVGDSVGQINSSVINRELAQLRGSLEVARSMLRVASTGEKQALVNEAQDQLSLSQEQAQLQRKILQRQKDLYDSNLVSREMYEITEGTSRIYDLEAEAAEARLKALATGSKPEQIQMSLAEINSLDHEIKVLEQRINQFKLISPLSGQLFTPFSAETLLVIADTSRLVYMPINLNNRPEVVADQMIQVYIETGDKPIRGKIAKLDQLIQRLNGRQVFFAIASLENKPNDLPLNQIVPCTIYGQSKTPLGYLEKIAQSIFN